ncbi:hypothetical protein [Pseudoalteromonas sp. Z1A8]|uniref:hypothetical protein n=1 Tax=Pseudoalteromonas sp. Z1A8 TaxID=2686354 RepID=UPI001F0E5BAF|nr:hypothetical protein [Pseudoalteromonas sp. Z1A8]
MVVPFAKLTTKIWVVLVSKIDKLFIGIGINNLKDAKQFSLGIVIGDIYESFVDEIGFRMGENLLVFED